MTDAEAISKHFLNSEEKQWQDTFQTNVFAQYFMSMAFLPLLAKGGKVTPGYTSQVVNVSSISGQMKGSSNGQFSYASSKAASTHLSRMLATTFKDCKVRVNVIAPGVFPSEMTTGESDENNKSELSTKLGNPAGRGGHDSDMAATILFLAGKGGLFYNEAILHPDGGECQHSHRLTWFHANHDTRSNSCAACCEVECILHQISTKKDILYHPL